MGLDARALAGLMAAIAVVAIGLSACASGEHIAGAPYHHIEGGFRNPPGNLPRRGGVLDWAAFFVRRIAAGMFSDVPTVPAGHALRPEAVRPGIDHAIDDGGDALTWLGHSTFLVRLSGKTILTDPFLSDHAGPIPPLGPRRFVAPALRAGELPPIDVIVVSHNHYDHLDAPTVEALPGKERIDVVVPLGLGPFFRQRGYVLVHELDWHQGVNFGGVEITALPVIHASARGLFDRNKTLWAGYALATPARRLFFSGDTAYGPVFRDVGDRYGPFDYGLVAIGGYDPRLLMDATHVTAEEAVRLADDMGIDTVIGMHWGTIRLTEEPIMQPVGRFRAAGRAVGWPDRRLWVMRIGETRGLD